jgi:hypothetical protein
MVDERLSDGVRVAELLASELVAAGLTVTDADPEVDPTVDGARAYEVRDGDDPLATVFVHPERARIEFRAGQRAAADAAREAGLRVRPKATDPPRTLVFVADGVEVKRVLPVVEAAV